MPVAAALGETFVGLQELDEAVEASGESLLNFLEQTQVDQSFSLRLSEHNAIRPADLTKARNVKSQSIAYQGIGVGKPLTIVVESIYLGDYPDALPWVPGFNEGDVLVTSGLRAFQTFEAAPRAVHMLERRAKRRSFLKAKAVESGSPLVYYTPAVTDASALFSIELSSDREFNEQLGEAFAKAVRAAGVLPVFAPAAPYLIAAGTAIPIVTKAAQLLARPQTFYAEHVELNFARPGVVLAQPDALLLFPGSDEKALTQKYKLGADFKLRHRETDEPYKGSLPYAVISLDGTERPELQGWSAQAASAVLLERFFTPDELMSKSLDVVSKSLALYNDMTYRDKAAEALKQLSTAEGAAKREAKERYLAYVKNIQNEDIRALVEGGATTG